MQCWPWGFVAGFPCRHPVQPQTKSCSLFSHKTHRQRRHHEMHCRWPRRFSSPSTTVHNPAANKTVHPGRTDKNHFHPSRGNRMKPKKLKSPGKKTKWRCSRCHGSSFFPSAPPFQKAPPLDASFAYGISQHLTTFYFSLFFRFVLSSRTT